MKHEPDLLNDWLRRGQPSPMDEALKDHLKSCPSCSREFDELLSYQVLLAAPESLIPEKKAAQIRFLLEAECNRKKQAGAGARRSVSVRRWAFGLVGAAALFLGLFFGVRIFLEARPAEDRPAPASMARIMPQSGARWSRVFEGTTEVIIVEDGTVEFEVNPLGPGQAFLVKTGADWVEVRGTRFSVSSEAGRMQKVNVTEGVVSVHLSSENVLLLAGQQWIRQPENQAVHPVAPDSTVHSPGPAPDAGQGRQNDALAEPPAPDSANPQSTPAPSAVPVPAPVPPMAPVVEPASMAAGLTQRSPEPVLESPTTLKFSEAYRTLQSGNWRRSVTLFTELLQERGLGAKRADVLFWLAQAHLKGGQYDQAIVRLREFTQSYPHSWRAKDAKSQLLQLQSRGR